MTLKRGESSVPDEMLGLSDKVHWHVVMSRSFHSLAWDACDAQGFVSFAAFVRDCVAERIAQVSPELTKEEVLALTPRMGHKFWLARQSMRRSEDGTFVKLDDEAPTGDLP